MNPKTHELKWHVVYTMPRSEQKVAMCVSDMGMESFLPMHTVVRQWSDRKKKMRVPLFPNYVFVRVNEVSRNYLYSIRELVNFVSIEKKPVVVRENEINAIKQVLDEAVDVSPEEYFYEGMNVQINHGQFAGLEGVVIKRNGNTRLMIRIEGLMKAFSFNISSKFLKAIPQDDVLVH